MSDKSHESKVLDALVGQQLSAVTFVQDYLQLDFEGKRLTINIWPTVSLSRNEFHIGDVGYRDALCAAIGADVAGTSETDSEILIRFDIGHIVISLAEDNGIERVIFEDVVTRTWAYW